MHMHSTTFSAKYQCLEKLKVSLCEFLTFLNLCLCTSNEVPVTYRSKFEQNTVGHG